MAAWLNVFLLIGISTALQWTLGGMALAIGGLNVKDFFFWKRELSLSIAYSAKPSFYTCMRAILTADRLLPSLTAVALLAVMVSFIELLYTAILIQQDLNPIAYYCLSGSLYTGLYN